MYAPQRFYYRNRLAEAALTVSTQSPGVVSGAQKTGVGSALLLAWGNYTGQSDRVYTVQIQSIAAGAAIGQATFRWRTSAMPAQTYGGVNLATSAAPISLGDGVFISFRPGLAPHCVVGDSWLIRAFANAGVAQALDIDPNTRLRWPRSQALIITADMSAPVEIAAFLLDGHNLSGDAVILLEGHSAPTWTTPAFRRRLMPAPRLVAEIAQTLRYWRLTIADANNAASEAQITHCYLGDALQLDEEADWGASDTQAWHIIETTTPAGVGNVALLSGQRRYQLNYDGLHNADMAAIEAMTQTLNDRARGQRKALFFHLFSDEPDTVWPMRIVGDTQRVFLGVDRNACSLTLHELPQTIAPFADNTGRVTPLADPLDALVETITQAGHGFAVGDTVTHHASGYVRTLANAPQTAAPLGMITRVNGDDFDLLLFGWIDDPTAALLPGTWYFTSGVAPGALTAVVPNWDYGAPVVFAVSATRALVAPDAYALKTAAAIDRIAETLTQAGHGFSAGQAVRFDGAAYVPAQADSAVNALALGIVESVDGDAFTVVHQGAIAYAPADAQPGSRYWLSELTPGALTPLMPLDGYDRPLLRMMSASAGIVAHVRPDPIVSTYEAIDAIAETLTQAGHGFSAGQAVRFDGADYVAAQADSADHAETLGVIASVSGDDFTVVYLGRMTLSSAAYTPGEVYWLDAATPGALTVTPPTAPGTIAKPLLFAVSTTAALILQSRGNVNISQP